MKKVMQTKTGIGGNCEGATLATLLGLSINDIPDFWEGCDKSKPTCTVEGAKYQANLNNFLASKGLKAISLGFHEPSEDSEKWVQEISKAAGIKHLVNGISPRGYMHSVIYENGQLWHDPHPQGGGVKPCQITFLNPIFDDEAAWQAAKAKAIPEGFVLVPKEPTPKMIDSTWNYDEEIQEMSHNSRNEFIYKKMIEVQEQVSG